MARNDYAHGDYRVVADRLRPAAVELVAWCNPEPGAIVADSACGTGNVAWACVDRGCRVVAIDLEIKQLRAMDPSQHGDVQALVGDVLALPLATGAVDHVLSTFGMVYAPDPEVATREAARVCRSGGLVALTSWAAAGFQTRAQQLLADAEPRDGAHGPAIPAVWTSVDALQTTLALVGDVEVRRGWLESPIDSPAAWWAHASASAPPIVAARSRLTPSAFRTLGQRLQELVDECSEIVDGGLLLREEYLLARVRVR